MALAQCKECGEQVSTGAKTCPKCGLKNPTGRMSKIVIGIVLLFTVGAIANVTRSPQQQQEDDFETARTRWISGNEAASEAAVRRKLKDPESAVFRRMGVMAPEKFDPKALGTVCGEVNAKNSFGGYTGFSNFVSVDGLTFMDDGSKAFNRIWDARCANGKPVWRL